MNEIKTFANKEFGQVRTLVIDNEPWFVGKDVANILEYRNGSRDINRHVDEDDKCKTMIFDGNQNKETIIINESGLYSLILSSKLPTAKKFKHWVTSEVLPSIRKTGGYNLPDFSNPAIAARAWADQYEARQKAEKELEEAKPLAEQTVRFIEHDHLIGFRELAKELNIKEPELNRILIENGWKYKSGNKYKYRKACITKGYMGTKDIMNEDTGWSGTCDKFTIKGRMAIEKLIDKEDIE